MSVFPLYMTNEEISLNGQPELDLPILAFSRSSAERKNV